MSQFSEHRSRLQLLIASVRKSTPAVQQVAARVEEAPREQQMADGVDVKVVDQWLRDVAQIAAISCDQTDLVSKELGARLEAQSANFETQIKESGSWPLCVGAR